MWLLSCVFHILVSTSHADWFSVVLYRMSVLLTVLCCALDLSFCVQHLRSTQRQIVSYNARPRRYHNIIPYFNSLLELDVHTPRTPVSFDDRDVALGFSFFVPESAQPSGREMIWLLQQLHDPAWQSVFPMMYLSKWKPLCCVLGI